MLEAYKTLIANQFEAALCMLNRCMDRCPDAGWNARVGSYPFSQVMFHTLFFTDYYLGQNEAGLREQQFHKKHAEFFADYEQTQPREPVSVYERGPLKEYLQFCRDKAAETVAAETAETLVANAGFARRTFSRAELHVYNIRHIQHHAAQLSLRLRLDHGEDIPWFGSGWRET